jgi:hypothetical protein
MPGAGSVDLEPLQTQLSEMFSEFQIIIVLTLMVSLFFVGFGHGRR